MVVGLVELANHARLFDDGIIMLILILFLSKRCIIRIRRRLHCRSGVSSVSMGLGVTRLDGIVATEPNRCVIGAMNQFARTVRG